MIFQDFSNKSYIFKKFIKFKNDDKIMDVLMALLFILCAYFAEIVGTMAGFGSSIIFLPLALIFVDFRLALVMVAITHISGNTGRITFFRSGLDKKLIIIFGIPSIILTLLGSYLVNYTSQELLKLCLGLFLMSFGLLSLYKSNLEFPATKLTAIAGGGISGFFAGLIGTGGAPCVFFSRIYSFKYVFFYPPSFFNCNSRIIYWKKLFK